MVWVVRGKVKKISDMGGHINYIDMWGKYRISGMVKEYDEDEATRGWDEGGVSKNINLI